MSQNKLKVGSAVGIRIGPSFRRVIVLKGASRPFANSLEDVYIGEVQLEPFDPYGEPYTIVFKASEALPIRTLWETANTSWSDLTPDEQDELIGSCLRIESVNVLGDDGLARRAKKRRRKMISRVRDEMILHKGASAHAEYIFWNYPYALTLQLAAYGYDSADDGPEVAAIRAIRAKHYVLDLKAERLRLL